MPELVNSCLSMFELPESFSTFQCPGHPAGRQNLSTCWWNSGIGILHKASRKVSRVPTSRTTVLNRGRSQRHPGVCARAGLPPLPIHLCIPSSIQPSFLPSFFLPSRLPSFFPPPFLASFHLVNKYLLRLLELVCSRRWTYRSKQNGQKAADLKQFVYLNSVRQVRKQTPGGGVQCGSICESKKNPKEPKCLTVRVVGPRSPKQRSGT